jgi:hypothetical protein
MNKTIDLTNCVPTLIVVDKKGQKFYNQVGGVMCLQEEVKGWIYPLNIKNYKDYFCFNRDVWYSLIKFDITNGFKYKEKGIRDNWQDIAKMYINITDTEKLIKSKKEVTKEQLVEYVENRNKLEIYDEEKIKKAIFENISDFFNSEMNMDIKFKDCDQYEAWIQLYATINGRKRKCILTWENCD